MAKNVLSSINTGLGKIYYSILNESEGTYGIPKEIGDLISIGVNPTENSQSLWAGDRQLIIDSSIQVDGTFGVAGITNEVLCDIFGYKMGTKGELIYSSATKRPKIALLVQFNNYDNVQDYMTLWECRVDLAGMQGNTKNDSVSYGTKEFSYKVLIPADKVYMSIISSDEADCPEDIATTFFTTAPVKPTIKPEA